MHDLVLVLPFYSFGENAAVCCRLVGVRAGLVERVRSLELPPVMRVAVADHYLGGVLVGHDDGGFGQLGPRGGRVVWHERLLAHTRVLDAVDLEGFCGPGHCLGGSLGVLVRGRCFPAGLLERELHGNCFAVLAQDVRAGLDSSVVEEGC